MHRKITRQSRWNLSRESDTAIPNQTLKLGEGVETGWRAPHVGEGTVRLSPKGESDRITQRSVVQIHPPQLSNATVHKAVAFDLNEMQPINDVLGAHASSHANGGQSRNV